MRERDLPAWKQTLLEGFRDGQLLRNRDAATRAHGHGTCYDEDGREVRLGFFTSLASQLLDGRRVAEDGRSYTYAEFVQWYGSESDHNRWTNAAMWPAAAP